MITLVIAEHDNASIKATIGIYLATRRRHHCASPDPQAARLN